MVGRKPWRPVWAHLRSQRIPWTERSKCCWSTPTGLIPLLPIIHNAGSIWGNAVSWVKSRLSRCFPNGYEIEPCSSNNAWTSAKWQLNDQFQWNIIHFPIFSHISPYFPHVFSCFSSFCPIFFALLPPPSPSPTLGFRAAPKFGDCHGRALAWPGPTSHSSGNSQNKWFIHVGFHKWGVPQNGKMVGF